VRDPGSPVEFLNWKARLAVELGGALSDPPGSPHPSRPPADGWRKAWFGGAAPVETAIFEGAALPPGAVIVGPAIIEEPTSTLVVPQGEEVRLSRFGNYLVDLA
jgi:N-methylhydantoinase A